MIQKSKGTTIVFNEELLRALPKVVVKMGIPPFLNAVKNEVPNFCPQDTQSLINSDYEIIDIDAKWGIIGYGSKFDPSDPINEIAVKQHEEVLNHYGTPGVSMREGVQGANIPGKKYAIFGKSLIRDEVLGKQRDDYEKGYLQKKENGELTPYATKFLEKAIYKVVNSGMEKFFGEKTVIEPIANAQKKQGLKKSDKLPKGVL